MRLIQWITELIRQHEGLAGLLTIAFILHLPAPAELPQLDNFSARALVRWFGDWGRCVYGWVRDSLQAYVNRPAKKD